MIPTALQGWLEGRRPEQLHDAVDAPPKTDEYARFTTSKDELPGATNLALKTEEAGWTSFLVDTSRTRQ
jgi:hypothetical protein